MISLLAAATLFTACKEDDEVPIGPQGADGISIAEVAEGATLTMTVAESKALSVSLTPAGDAAGVSWKATPAGIVEITGNTLKALKHGTATITAMAPDRSTAMTTFNVLVVVANPITSITGVPEGDVSMDMGEEILFTPVVAPADASVKTLAMTITPPEDQDAAVKIEAMKDEEGNLTGEYKMSAEAVGTSTVTIAATDGSGTKEEFTVTVTNLMDVLMSADGNGAFMMVPGEEGYKRILKSGYGSGIMLPYSVSPDGTLIAIASLISELPQTLLYTPSYGAPRDYSPYFDGIALGATFSTDGKTLYTPVIDLSMIMGGTFSSDVTTADAARTTFTLTALDLATNKVTELYAFYGQEPSDAMFLQPTSDPNLLLLGLADARSEVPGVYLFDIKEKKLTSILAPDEIAGTGYSMMQYLPQSNRMLVQETSEMGDDRLAIYDLEGENRVEIAIPAGTVLVMASMNRDEDMIVWADDSAYPQRTFLATIDAATGALTDIAVSVDIEGTAFFVAVDQALYKGLESFDELDYTDYDF